MAVTYHKFYSEVTSDMSIPAPALKLYTLLLDMSNIQTGETLPIYICQIAKKLNHSERTVQTWLAELIERGLLYVSSARIKTIQDGTTAATSLSLTYETQTAAPKRGSKLKHKKLPYLVQVSFTQKERVLERVRI